MGPLHDPITWYETNYAGKQVTQWDFENKGTGTSPARLFSCNIYTFSNRQMMRRIKKSSAQQGEEEVFTIYGKWNLGVKGQLLSLQEKPECVTNQMKATE